MAAPRASCSRCGVSVRMDKVIRRWYLDVDTDALHCPACLRPGELDVAADNAAELAAELAAARGAR